MASFRARLSRLGPPPPTQPPASEPAPKASSATASVEVLRERIAALVARGHDRAPRRAADPANGELPFVRIETPAGPLYRRVVRYPASHRVGRFAVADAKSADPTLIALLALDPSLAAIDPRSILYVDTETTGLAGGTGTVAFLLGMARFEEDGAFVLEQLLLRQLGEEAPILARLAAEVERAGCLASYNGKSFDLPLLRSRLVMSRLAALPPRPHLDLVHVARRVHRGRLRSMHLAGVEEHVLGYVRVDDVPSGEVVARYRHFLRTGDDSALLGVVIHNEWDIVTLAALVGLYGAPLGSLVAQDLAGVARTLRRARSLDRADEMANEAVTRGGGTDALRERAAIARARGERDRAIGDLEALLAQVDDPVARLDLAKLYEHHLGAPGAALALLEGATPEDPARAEHRRGRLREKVRRDVQASLPGLPKRRKRRTN